MNKTIGLFIAFGAALLIGIAAIVAGACGENGAFDGSMDIADLTKENAKDGLIVSGDIYGIWDKYAEQEKEENGETKIVAEYFTMVMPYSFNEESPVFIGISSSDSNEIEGLEQMRSEVEGIITDDVSPEYHTKMSFKGKLKKLDEGQLSFLKVSVSTLLGITTDDAEEYIAPFVIESYNGSNFAPLLIAGIALAIIGFGGALVMIFKDLGEDNG